MNLDALALLPGRCAHGFHVTQRALCEDCTPTEWDVFVAAVRQATRPDGTVRQNDIRPLVRGRIPSKSIGRLYALAYDRQFLVRIDEEPSNDVVGRNTNKNAGVYRVAA